MKIAFLILAHTDPPQLERLVKAIDYDCRIFIHVDEKSDIRHFFSLNLPDTVEFIKDRTRVHWAGFNMIKATLAIIKAALDSGEDYSHLVLLSGQDYPIKPIAQLYEFLTSAPNKQFIRFISIKDSPEYYLKRARKYWFYDRWAPKFDTKLRKKVGSITSVFFKKKLLKDIDHAYGCQMWAITPACARYVVDYAENNKDFVRWHKTSPAPDETFFHTIVANSPFLNQTEGFKKYKGRGVYQFANLHVIHHSANKIYDVTDFEELKNSDKYFVRKVTTEKSSKLLDRIDVELLNPKVKVPV